MVLHRGSQHKKFLNTDGIFPSLYFPVFELNKEIYSVKLHKTDRLR